MQDKPFLHLKIFQWKLFSPRPGFPGRPVRVPGLLCRDEGGAHESAEPGRGRRQQGGVHESQQRDGELQDPSALPHHEEECRGYQRQLQGLLGLYGWGEPAFFFFDVLNIEL